MLRGEPCLRLAHQGLDAAAFLDHFAHGAGQAFQAVGPLDGFGITADAGLEAVGVLAQGAQFGEHPLDQRFEGVAGAAALIAQGALAFAGAAQHLAEAEFERVVHRLTLALGPGIVLGQIDQAGTQLTAQLTHLGEQMLTVVEHLAGTAAQLGHLPGANFGGTEGEQFGLRGIQFGDQCVGMAFGRSEGVLDGGVQRRCDGRPGVRDVRYGRQ